MTTIPLPEVEQTDIDGENVGPRWFDDALAYIQHRLTQETNAHYLPVTSAIELCKEAAKYGLYIRWYECGIEHIKGDRRYYEGRETWGIKDAGFTKITTLEQAEQCNQIALDIILKDIEEGHTAFDICLEEVEGLR